MSIKKLISIANGALIIYERVRNHIINARNWFKKEYRKYRNKKIRSAVGTNNSATNTKRLGDIVRSIWIAKKNKEDSV